VLLETSTRWHLIFETAAIGFLCSTGVGCLIAKENRAVAAGYAIVIGVPFCAAAIYVAIASFYPNLIGDSKLRFPLTATLPLVFCCLLPVCSLLLVTPETGLLAPQETLAYAEIWKMPISLAVVFLSQVAALSFLAAVAHKRS
jgi:hypothetical protein